MLIPSNERLPEFGQVWGDKDAFDTFRQTVQAQHPEHWQPLCHWFQNATGDRGYVLEIPERQELQTILAGDAQLFSLTIVFGNPEAVEAQMRCGLESFIHGGLLIVMGERLELSTHT